MACSAALLCAGIALAASVGAAPPADNTILPDGTEFRFWDDTTVYSRTYHVA